MVEEDEFSLKQLREHCLNLKKNKSKVTCPHMKQQNMLYIGTSSKLN